MAAPLVAELSPAPDPARAVQLAAAVGLLDRDVIAIADDPDAVQDAVPVVLDDQPLAVAIELFGLPVPAPAGSAYAVILGRGDKRLGLVVDRLRGQQEVVIKSLGETFASVRGLAGGAILGDGRIGLILDAHGIVELERGVNRAAA